MAVSVGGAGNWPGRPAPRYERVMDDGAPAVGDGLGVGDCVEVDLDGGTYRGRVHGPPQALPWLDALPDACVSGRVFVPVRYADAIPGSRPGAP